MSEFLSRSRRNEASASTPLLYMLRVHYKSGAIRTVQDLSRIQLRCELAERLIDNEREDSVRMWEIFPENSRKT